MSLPKGISRIPADLEIPRCTRDDTERAIVGMRVNLALEIERIRKEEKLTQETIAKRIGTKQSGVARMLKCPASATIDSLVKTLLALGATPKRIAALI